MAFSDPAALTRLGDDLGYDRVFAEQHLSLCHAVLDIEMDWRGRSQPTAARETELVET
jgi:hypothetical protein